MTLGTIALIVAPAAFGGLERVVQALAEGVAADGWRVVLIVVHEPGIEVPEWARELEARGIAVEEVSSGRLAYIRERRVVAELLRRHGVDVVHTHGDRVDVLHGTAAAGAGRITVSTAHGFSRAGMKGRLIEWAHARALSRFRAVVAVSRPLAEVLMSRGIGAQKIVTIPNGLSTHAPPRLSREAARSQLGLVTDRRTIGWVGRFSREKDPMFQIRAFGAMIDREALLCMIGDGPELDACRALARELGVADRIVFAGAHQQAAILFAAFDAFALSSSTEGTPIVLLEAIDAPLPIVATRVGGVPDLITGVGKLVDHGDVGAMASCLDEIIKEPNDAAVRAIQRAKASTQDTRGAWVGRYSALYARLLAGGATNRLEMP